MKSTEPSPGPRDDSTVGQRVARGAAGLLIMRVGLRTLSIVNIAVLSRLLLPEDFGIIAIAMAIVGILGALTDLGVGSALVRLPAVTRAHLDTAFTLGLIRGLLTALFMAAAAFPLADFMNEPRLAEVVLALTPLSLIASLNNPNLIMFVREIRFGKEINVGVVNTLTASAVTIALAVALRDYWAMVGGALAAQIAATATTYRWRPYRPHLSLSEWRGFFAFGVWITAGAIVDQLTYKLDSIIIGRALGTRALGFYEVGQNISSIVTQEFASSLGRAVYPGLVAKSASLDHLRDAYQRTQAAIFYFIAPIGVGTSLVAPEAVRIFAGERWAESATVVQYIAPTLAIGVMAANFPSLMMTVGRTRELFYFRVTMLVTRIPILLGGLALGGLTGLLWARVWSGIILLFGASIITRTLLKSSLFELPRLVWRPIVALAIMAGAILAIFEQTAGDAPLSVAIAQLALKSFCGGMIYSVTVLLLWMVAGMSQSAPEGRLVAVAVKIAMKVRHLGHL